MTSPPNQSKPVIIADRLSIIIAITLLFVSTASWIAAYYLMLGMTVPGSGGLMSSGVEAIVSSTSIFSVSIFEATWIVGMIAMMFPAMLPVVLFYNKIVTKQEENPVLSKYAGTTLFLGGYLVIYALLGLAAYFAVYEAIKLSMNFPPGLTIISLAAASAILAATGIYQFTSLKSRCLSNCSSPMSFFAIRYHGGLVGSLRMGLSHGLFCAGCCWAFMLVMLGVGAMSVLVMAGLAGVIAIEKVLGRGKVWFNRAIGLAFLILAAAIILFPNL